MSENTNPSTEGKVNRNDDLKDKELVLICTTRPYWMVKEGEKANTAIEGKGTVDPNVLIESQPLDVVLGKEPISQATRDGLKKQELDIIRNRMKNFEYVDKESMRKLGMTDKEMDDYIKAQQSRQASASIEEK